MAAAATDTRQLLLQVDASISLAQRNLNQLASQIQRESQQMDQALGRVDAATERLGQSFVRQRARGRDTVVSLGQMRSGAQQLSFQIGDVAQQFAMGTRPMTIFAQQSGQVIQAFTMMRGSAGGFLGFLGGPWGAVITGAGIIAASFAGKLFEQGNAVDDLVKKMREKADQTRNNILADEAWKRTVEGLTEAIRKRREEQEKALQTDIQAEQAALAAARGGLRQAQNQREQIARELSSAQEELQRLRAVEARAGGRGAGPAGAAVAAQQQEVDRLRQQLADTMANVREAETTIRQSEVTIGERRVTAQLDAVKAATDRYTEALGRLREERTKGLITQSEFERRLTDETRRRDAAIKSARDAQRQTRSDRRTKAQAYQDFVEALREQGVNITSGYRSQAEQNRLRSKLGKDAAKFSLHTAHRAVDVPLSATDEQIMAAAAQAGLRGLRIQRKPGARGGPHGHVSWSGFGDRGDDAAIQDARRRAEEEAAREAEKLARNLASHNRDMAQTGEEILRARLEQAGSADDAAKVELEIINAQHDRLRAEVEESVRRGDRSQQQADEFLARQEIIVQMRRDAVERKRLADNAQEQLRDEEAAIGLRQELLEGARSLARTSAARRRIELELLDTMFAIRRARLEEALAAAELANNTREAARIQAEINALPQVRSQAEEGVRRDTAGPMERWIQSIPQDAAEIAEAFEEIRVRGLDSLADGIADVATGAKSLGEVFSDVSRQIIGDIARMVARMLIMRALMRIFPGLGGAVGGAAPGNDIVVTGLPTSLPGRATGGAVWPGRTYRVGERGEEAFAPKVPGVIIPNHALRYGGGRGQLTVHVHAQGAVLTSEVRRWVAEGVVLATETGGQSGLAKVVSKQQRLYP